MKQIANFMSFTFELIGIILGIAIVVFFIFKKLIAYKTKHARPVDPAAQALYDQKNAQKDEELDLTLQEKIELSWQFLTKITQRVLENFSTNDKEQVLTSGRKLVKNGARYQHNVNQESMVIKKSSKSRSVKQNKEAEISR